MRLSELLGREVVDADGSTVGGVADLALTQDGPMLGPHTASFRASALVVVARRHTQLLGYEREVRPAFFRAVVRRLAGAVYNVPWDHVADLTGDTVVLRVPRSELQEHHRGLRT